MRARAALTTELEARTDGRERTRISGLRSESPLLLRPTLAKEADPWTDGRDGVARVCLVAGAAGPLGGDQLSLRIEVGPASTLVLHDVSATLLLPGPRAERSRLEVEVEVRTGGTFVWLPDPVIVARGCDHEADIRISLEPDARLLARDELLLGRHGEEPGAIRQRYRVRLGGRPLLDQELAFGPEAPGSRGPAVSGGRRAIGSLLVVDPTWSEGPPEPMPLAGDAAVMPLSGPAALVSALCDEAPDLRRALAAGLDLLLLSHARDASDAPRLPAVDPEPAPT